jgi:RNA polymerase sigma factor (sigma-70 family)
MKTDSNSDSSGAKYARFENTQWTLIQHAGDLGSAAADTALETLCRAYWRPLYCYILRRGYRDEDAKDLTQAFFFRLLGKNYLSAVDRRKGKFRSFLLASLEHFIQNEWRSTQAQKRGGGLTFISFDETFDDSFPNIADAGQDAERVLEQQWAIAMLKQILDRLQGESAHRNSGPWFEDIKPALICEPTENSYAQIAEKHNTTEAAIKMTVKRLRKRFGELLVEELSNTVSTPEQLEEELRALFAAFN